MHQLVHLRFCGGDHVRVAMPGVDDGDAREAIQIFPAVDIRYGGATGFIDDDGCDRFEEAGHHIVFVFLDSVEHSALRSGENSRYSRKVGG
jgi:hypothetical protein